jgi:hypothetical protein
MERRARELVASLPTEWLENYVGTYEAGRVQRHPQTRFVNARGECCLVAALAGVRCGRELTGTRAWATFRGGPLEELSRLFEARRLSGGSFYDEAVLALVERRSAAVAAESGRAAGVAAVPGRPFNTEARRTPGYTEVLAGSSG